MARRLASLQYVDDYDADGLVTSVARLLEGSPMHLSAPSASFSPRH